MTAHICFKTGKYLNNRDYERSMYLVMDAVSEIVVVNLTILFSENVGVKKEGLTVPEAKAEIENACRVADNMPDDIKQFLLSEYLEVNPDEVHSL